MMESKDLKKTVGIVLVMLFLLSGVPGSLTASIQQETLTDNDFKEIDESMFNWNQQPRLFPRSNDMIFWVLWRNFPGRYEPFFVFEDIHKYGQCTWGLASADFNNDGYLDFAAIWREAGSYDGGISLFMNQGNQKFSEQFITSIQDLGLDPEDSTESVPLSDLDAADYDGDDDIDLLFTYSISAEYNGERISEGRGIILFNNGNNHFDQYEMVFQHSPYMDENRKNPQVSSADFDQDGDIDFVVGDNSGLVAFYKNDGVGHFDCVDTYHFGGEKSWGISNGDYDNDGYIDVIVTQIEEYDENGSIFLVRNDGSLDCFNYSNAVVIANAIPEPSFFSSPIFGGGSLQSLDYNNDGLMDFILTKKANVFLYMQTVTGDFDYVHVCRLPAVYNKPFTWFTEDVDLGGLTAGDFNNDGLDDLLIGGDQGFIRLCTNQFVLIDIIKPDVSAVFVNDEIISGGIPLYSFLKHGTALVKGDIAIVAKELEQLSKVEFYLDNKLVFIDEESPFEWEWNTFSFGRHMVKAQAYDLEGNPAGFDSARVWKFL